MKLLYLAFIRLPTEKAHGAQIMKTCEAFAHEGAEVELVVPGRHTPIEGDAFTHYGVQKNFTLTTLGTPDWVSLGSVGYVLSGLWFSEAAKWRKNFWNADIVYSRDAFVLLQYLLLGRSLVYEAHTHPTYVSRFVARQAKWVVVISEGLRDAYVQAGVSSTKIVVAHDAIDTAAFQNTVSKEEARRRLGIPQDKVVALYVGRVDAAKGAGTFARAAELLHEGYAAVIIGSGPLVDVLRRTYSKVLLLPETPYKDLPQVLAAADILVAPNSALDLDASTYTSPMKAFAYLAAKKPVLASSVPALRAIFEEGARYVKPDDADDLAEAIEDPETLKYVPTREPFSWKDRARAILAILR